MNVLVHASSSDKKSKINQFGAHLPGEVILRSAAQTRFIVVLVTQNNGNSYASPKGLSIAVASIPPKKRPPSSVTTKQSSILMPNSP